MLRAILVYALYGTGTVLGLSATAYACSFFIWSEIFRPTSFARGFAELPEAYVVGAVLLLSVLIRRWKRRWNPVATVLAVMVGWILICALFAQSQVVAWKAASFYLKYLIPLLIISISLVTRFSQNLFVWTLAASVGIWSAQSGVHALLQGGPQTNLSIPGGQMTDRNDFMVGIVAAVPLIAYTAWCYRGVFQRWIRIVAKIALILSIIVVPLSLSRGGTIGLSVLLLYYMIATGKFRKRFILGAIVICAALTLVPTFVTQRMTTIDMSTEHQSEGSAASRLNLIKCGTEMALDHPIVGVGPGNFKYIVMSYGHPGQHDPHNIWIKAATEYGFPMLILFLMILGLLLRGLMSEAKRSRVEGDREADLMATALACSIVGFLASATFTSHFLSEYFWATTAVAGAFLARREHERRTAPLLRPDEADENPARQPARV